jgi:hypothetical protein
MNVQLRPSQANASMSMSFQPKMNPMLKRSTSCSSSRNSDHSTDTDSLTGLLSAGRQSRSGRSNSHTTQQVLHIQQLNAIDSTIGYSQTASYSQEKTSSCQAGYRRSKKSRTSKDELDIVHHGSPSSASRLPAGSCLFDDDGDDNDIDLDEILMLTLGNDEDEGDQSDD